MEIPARFQRILGVRFVVCGAAEEMERVCRQGGLVVMPSGPALNLLSGREANQGAYREALLGADLVLPDSALMVMAWNIVQRDSVPKFSGLKYLRKLLRRPELQCRASTLWVMPSELSARRNVEWLRSIGLPADEVYVAPIYGVRGAAFEDAELLRRIEGLRPQHVILGLAGGTQERLGFYLKVNLSYKPAIHCIGAAIAFLSGDQVRIPIWVDRAGLGWLWRTASNPARYFPRYWAARRVASMIFHYRDRLPIPTEAEAGLGTVLPPAPAEN